MEWTNKDIAQTFYTRIESHPAMHQCHLCGDTIKQKVATGYTNLLNHLKARHPRYREELQLADIIVAPYKMKEDANDSAVESIGDDTNATACEQSKNEALSKKAKKNQALVNYYYDKIDEDHYRCKTAACQRVYAQRRGTGYTNLKYHLRVCIGRNFEAQYKKIHMKDGSNGLDYSTKSDSDTEDNEGVEGDVAKQEEVDIERDSQCSMQEKESTSVGFCAEKQEVNERDTAELTKVEHVRSENDQDTLENATSQPQPNSAHTSATTRKNHKRKSTAVNSSRSTSSHEESDYLLSKQSKTTPRYRRTKSKKTNELLDIHQAMFREMIDAHERSLMKFLQFEREEREKDRLAHMQIMTTMIKAFVHPHQ